MGVTMAVMRHLPDVQIARAATVLLSGLIALGCVPAPVGRATPAPAGPTPTPSPTPTPTPAGPTPTLSFVRPTPTPQPPFVIHVVVAGDTLTSIGRRYETTARSIAFWNRERYPSLDPDSPGYAPDRIKVGWELQLLPGKEVDPEDLPEPSDEPSLAASGEPSTDPDEEFVDP
jgi:hypothetical protein